MITTTDYGINISDYIGSDSLGGGSFSPIRNKVLLHEPEQCMTCGKSFLSLYPIKCCSDHNGLDSL